MSSISRAPGARYISSFKRARPEQLLADDKAPHPVVFGRVPLFYYVVHLLLLHAFAVLFCGLPIGAAKPEDYGLELPGVYLVWIVAVVALYLPCRWFAEVKHRRNDVWLSYL